MQYNYVSHILFHTYLPYYLQYLYIKIYIYKDNKLVLSLFGKISLFIIVFHLINFLSPTLRFFLKYLNLLCTILVHLPIWIIAPAHSV